MNIPKAELDKLSPTVKEKFLQWNDFMDRFVKFNMPESIIHASTHCERVLLYALIIGEKIFGNNNEFLDILAQAAVFHDTRRLDDDLDTGHGARAAVYYKQFCQNNKNISFYPEALYLMRFHDQDDTLGVEAIRKSFSENTECVLNLYAIFKDADALDRWRLGSCGLDPKFLRTETARNLTDFSQHIVWDSLTLCHP